MPAGNASPPPPPAVAAAADPTKGANAPCACAATAPADAAAPQMCSTCRCRCPTRDGQARPVPGENAEEEEVDGNGEEALRVLGAGALVDEPFTEDAEEEDDEAASSADTPPASPRTAGKRLPTRRRTEPLIISTTSARAPAPTKPKPVRAATTAAGYTLDPFVDITRLRIRSRGSHCLYPGASFQGIQKSGTNNYEVNVQIVDVDLPSSFLCGYLCIRGLTEDWPEMTTYFDAEIIGTHHGFMTGKWGATDAEDLTHWARFPAFRQMRHEVEGPRQTLPTRERSVIFMRWKERFLVPDHRVQDVTGASFAGFYYICIDMEGRSGADVTRSPVASTRPLPGQDALLPPKTPTSPKLMREMLPSAMHRRTSSGSRLGPALMSGFYYHANSEPYQQLSLSHVPEVSQSSFEFR